MLEIVNIKECEKHHPDEWLLFEVVECDEHNHPVKGMLLAYSKDRDEIHNVAMTSQAKELFCYYNGDPIPKDMAVAL